MLVGYGCVRSASFQLLAASFQLLPCREHRLQFKQEKSQQPEASGEKLSFWLGDQDSNLDKCLQRALSYH